MTALLAAAACGGDADADAASAMAPPRVDVAALPAAQVPELVLRQCHDGLQGVERFAATVTLPDDGGTVTAVADLPQRLRAQWPDGTVQLMRDGRVQRLQPDGGVVDDADADAVNRLRALHRLLDVAALGPLHRCIGCERLDAATFRLAQPAGEPWTLRLQPDALLVQQLAGPDGAVDVLEHLRTQTTWIVRRARIDGLGDCAIRFEAIDFRWEPATFERPASTGERPAAAGTDAGQPPPEATERPAGVVVGAPGRPAVPQLGVARGNRWLVMADPIDWAARAELVQQRLRFLEQHGQTMAGFAGLLRDGERAMLVLPFRAAEGAADFAPPDGWDVRTFDTSPCLEVYPPAGDLDQRIATGERQLRAAMQQQGLRAIGPVLAQPFLHLDEATPTAEQQQAPVVRVSVAVR